jgi:hypothetical protein
MSARAERLDHVHLFLGEHQPPMPLESGRGRAELLVQRKIGQLIGRRQK